MHGINVYGLRAFVYGLQTIFAFEYGTNAFVDGLQRTCVFEYGSLAFVYGSLVFVYGLQLDVVLRKSYSVAQDTILIRHSLLERDEWGIVNAGNC